VFLEQSITSQPIGFDPDPFDHSGTIAWRHQWDSNHTFSPGEKPGALILADQDGHTCVYATLPYYLIRDTTLHRGLYLGRVSVRTDPFDHLVL
jgi:hypothetical protein